MTESLKGVFSQGMLRLVDPQQTLARITPLLAGMGITRCADITGLDRDLGVPTYTAVRPSGLVLQTGNGKGLTHTAAKVSALMEAIELYHAENPATGIFQRASLRQMRDCGETALVPKRDQADRSYYYTEDYRIDWVEAEELQSGKKVRIPACAAYFIEPTITKTTTNGLASGNHLVEATLHGLYELIERDATARLSVDGEMKIKGWCEVIDPDSLPNPLRDIGRTIERAETRLILLKIPCDLGVHVFWAVLLNREPYRAVTALNSGYGAHANMEVAAIRAITEAVQSRLTLIQASRDDIIDKPSFQRADVKAGTAWRYFDSLQADTRWDLVAYGQELVEKDLGRQLTVLLETLRERGHDTILRVNLQHTDIGVPVVKMIVPSLRFQRGLF